MAEEQEEQNRAERPTTFKLQKARERGVVARGPDLGFATSLAAGVACLWLFGLRMGQGLMETMRRAIVVAPQVVAGPDQLFSVTSLVLSSVVRSLVLVVLVVFVTVLAFEIMQTGAVFSLRPLALDFNRLNPANGLKRLFKVRQLLEALKNVLKLAVLTAITAVLIRQVLARDVGGISDGAQLAQAMWAETLRFLGLALAAAIVFAAIDQVISWRG